MVEKREATTSYWANSVTMWRYSDEYAERVLSVSLSPMFSA